MRPTEHGRVQGAHDFSTVYITFYAKYVRIQYICNAVLL